MAGQTCLCSMATRALLRDLASDHGGDGGARVEVVAVGGVDAARRVRAGESFDVVVLASPVMAALAGEGFVLPDSLAAVARSGMAAAVRAGLPHPGLRDADEFAAALRGAGRIAYSTGPSGDHLLRLVDRLGLGAALADRLLQAPPGVPVAALLAEGRAELGFQQASEFVGQPGIDVVGPLPPDCQAVTVFTAGICRTTADPEAARRFVAALGAPTAAAAKLRHGLEPA